MHQPPEGQDAITEYHPGIMSTMISLPIGSARTTLGARRTASLEPATGGRFF